MVTVLLSEVCLFVRGIEFQREKNKECCHLLKTRQKKARVRA
jgi:hypothetical protein